MNLAKALQIKISELRPSVGTADAELAKTQAKAISAALQAGRDVLLDAKDIIETAKPDLTAVNESMKLLNEKRAFYLNMPASYITGDLAGGGLSDSGQGDAKAVDRGLRPYFYSIIKPIFEAMFEIKCAYKPQDLSHINSGLEVLKTFGITDEEFLSKDNKTAIVNKVFDLPEDSKEV